MVVRQGYIKLHRQIIQKSDWPGRERREFTKFEARIDMILVLASGMDNGAVNRGQFLSSLGFLSRRWLWSKNKVDRFLNSLKNKREINRFSLKDTERTTERWTERVTITKYNHFNPIAERTTERVTDHLIKRKNIKERDKGERWASILTEGWNEIESLPTHTSPAIQQRTAEAVILRSKEDRLTLTQLREAVSVWGAVRGREDLWSMPWELPEFLSRRQGYWVRACLSDNWEEVFQKYEAKDRSGQREPEVLANWRVGSRPGEFE